MIWAASQAHAVTGAICISSTLNGSLKMRATGTCKPKEIQLGSFDGTTLQSSGINVQVVSGSGKTDAAANGKGNLIVGYNEAGVCSGTLDLCSTNGDCPSGETCGPSSTTIGSHNLIVGALNSYNSYSGFVAGLRNTSSGPFASVTGGRDNTAGGFAGSVSGGRNLSQPVQYGWAAGSLSPNVVVGDFESP